ncbi:C4-dicarboxylate ABC transporter [Actinophytocola xinjiangensis]|uniref:C4-dicarboxylate ABC transporter n=2 Tax=Actinophytocola xinjiangensis TaxID=485602 RepID=A0A7Z0WI45_9PSEU|nr:C4-dicarboxylate ABC transporter [Actinophytocola xinjiangensis]
MTPPKTRRRTGFVGLAAALSLVLTACGDDGGGSGGAEYSWRLAEVHPENYPTTVGDQKFAELVAEKSDGRITIDVYPGAQLGEESDAIEQVQLGSIELTRVSSAPMTEFASGMGLFGLPYIWDDADHMWRFLKDEDGGEKLLDGLSDAGFHGVTYMDPGARSFYTTDKAVRSPDDLKGLKIRVQESQVIIDFIEALGASPTPMDYGEVYSSLQSGLIDGAENNAPSYYSASHFEVAKNFTLDEHMRVAELLVMNRDIWDSLSADDQAIIEDAATEAAEFQRTTWDAQVDKDMAALKKEGVTITEIDDLEPWRAAARPVIDKYGDEFADYLAKIDELRE